MTRYVIPLDALQPDDRPRVGGKAAGLGWLIAGGMHVPPGFAVTTDAYREGCVGSRLHEEIAGILESVTGTAGLQAASDRIRDRFEEQPLIRDVGEEVRAAYSALCAGYEGDDVPVAVRSSATAEDLADASFAGQQETYLWVRGADDVAQYVVRCWASLFTPQAVSYRADRGIGLDDLAMAVVVQRMVDATAAGVMITLDPVTGDPSQVTIEASYGLGLAVVGGEVTPDRYAVDKVTWDMRDRTIAEKPFAYRFDPNRAGVAQIDVPADDRALPAITDDEAIALARLGRSVERAHGAPQDIEWAIGPGGDGPREMFLLQTRPETVWSRKRRAPIADPNEDILSRMLKSMSVPMRIRDAAPPPDTSVPTDPAP